VQKGGARFDYDKAKWVNQQHVKRLEQKEMEALIKEHRPDLTDTFDAGEMSKISELIQERVVLLNDISGLCAMFLEAPAAYDEKALQKILKLDINNLISEIKTLVNKNQLESLKDAVFLFCKEKEIGVGEIMQTLRLAVVGSLSGPDIIEVIKVIGKSSTLDRLEMLKKHI
jgi:glutamyl/glutaminyl-tRNA synthetase